jgi:hypothetical protein
MDQLAQTAAGKGIAGLYGKEAVPAVGTVEQTAVQKELLHIKQQ